MGAGHRFRRVILSRLRDIVLNGQVGNSLWDGFVAQQVSEQMTYVGGYCKAQNDGIRVSNGAELVVDQLHMMNGTAVLAYMSPEDLAVCIRGMCTFLGVTLVWKLTTQKREMQTTRYFSESTWLLIIVSMPESFWTTR